MKIQIDWNIYKRIMTWVLAGDGEVSGLGRVVIADGVATVTSAMILDANGSAAYTEISPEMVAKASYQTREQQGRLAFWWHSHVNMNTFWSGTDTHTIDDMAETGGVCVAVVFNKKKEMTGAVSFKSQTPFGEMVIAYRDIPVEITDRPDALEDSAALTEFKELRAKQQPVKPEPWEYTTPTKIGHYKRTMWGTDDAEMGMYFALNVEAEALGVSPKH